MPPGKSLILWLAFLLLGGCWHGEETTRAASISPPRVGDYLTLAVSWSPTYCLTEAGRNDRPQCGLKANQGKRYAFVVHGLWPQYDTPRDGRRWPEYCLDPAPWIDEADIDQALEFMPSRKLVIHQWKKHGTCYASSPGAYVEATGELFESIAIPRQFRQTTEVLTLSPDALRRAFLDANPLLSGAMISIQCGSRRDRARLSEIRICFSARGQPQACGGNEKRQCRARNIVLPPVR